MFLAITYSWTAVQVLILICVGISDGVLIHSFNSFSLSCFLSPLCGLFHRVYQLERIYDVIYIYVEFMFFRFVG